ncbi:hypothetical protein ACVD14_12340 [Escherichia coli]
MGIKKLLLISSCLLFFPESYATYQSMSPLFQHYTLVCEREKINPGINLSAYFSDNNFDLYQYYAFRCPDIEKQVRGLSISVLLRASVKSPFEDRLMFQHHMLFILIITSIKQWTGVMMATGKNQC